MVKSGIEGTEEDMIDAKGHSREQEYTSRHDSL
jgi:hypothetical protein